MKGLKEMLNEALMLNSTLKKYRKDIEKFLSDYDWKKVKPMDVVIEFEYGDEYYTLVNDIMNHLEIDDDKPEYDDIYYGVGPIIRDFLKRNKMWK
jgi:hypothetical protein